MAIDFPNTPTTNATYTVGNKTWIYDGTTWNTYNSTSFSAETLPGTTIKSTVTGSSLTSVGALGSLAVTGDLTIDTTTLKVDSTNNRVGIGISSPSTALDVVGTTTLKTVKAGSGAVAISSASFSSGFGTTNYNTSTPHNFVTGDTVAVTGITPSSFNRTATITVVSSTQFFFSLFNGSTGGAYSSGGTATGPPSTLYVDVTNDRVGIGTSSPTEKLDVNGVTKATQFLQGTDYHSPYQGFRNKIINGSFEFWQRGTARTYLNAGSYLADRWTIRQYQNGSHQRTTVTPVTGMQTRYALKVGSSTTAENAGGTRMWADTALESGDSIPLRGKTVTLSFWVRFSSATATSSTATPYGNFGGTINWNTSTTDAAMGTTGYDGGSSTTITNGSLPTTWTKYTVSGTISSSANNVSVQFGFTNLGSTAVADTVWYEVTQVQLEVGSVATPFEQRPMQTELALCQRYFQKSYGTSVTVGTSTDAGFYAFYGSSNIYGLLLGTIQLRVPMRVTPTTITYYRSGGANLTGWDYGNTSGTTGTANPTTAYATDTSFTPYVQIGGSYASGNMYGHWVASAEL